MSGLGLGLGLGLGAGVGLGLGLGLGLPAPRGADAHLGRVKPRQTKRDGEPWVGLGLGFGLGLGLGLGLARWPALPGMPFSGHASQPSSQCADGSSTWVQAYGLKHYGLRWGVQAYEFTQMGSGIWVRAYGFRRWVAHARW